ncbi:CD109 antigen-like [Limulus polyphemus]|uniref:CD109 antigen-like n=1 Tax=Limulus polyphemus TaxID=6850 RepID=A0ABM1S1C4_LIMPO|nr:CD109 antigen-like [Limulus polyphemus]
MISTFFILLTITTSPGLFHTDFTENEVKIHRIQNDPTYFILASRVIRPGQPYRVYVTVYRPSIPITVKASIQRDGVDLASTTKQYRSNVPETLLLKVPPNSVPGVYKLRVEGNMNGVLGGTAFVNETLLEFSQRSMTIFVQTDSPIYRQGQIVRFRTIPINTSLKAYSDAVDVYMLGPRGTIMRKWLSRQTNRGAVSLEYQLSEQPPFGTWTIRVVVQGQVGEKTFLVEEYYQTPYEVNLSMPAFFMDTNDYIQGYVTANYSGGSSVYGNLTVTTTSMEYLVNDNRSRSRSPELQHVLDVFEGFATFQFKMRELTQLVSNTGGIKVRVTACVGELFLDRVECGFSEAIIFNSSIKLQFLGSSPQVFKPSMPFKAYLAVSYHDGSALPPWRLSNQKLDIKPILTLVNGASEKLDIKHELLSPVRPGVWELELDLKAELGGKTLLNNVKTLSLEAYYKDETGERSTANLLVYASYSPTERHLQVSTSTKHPKVREFVIFHVRADYFVENFSYVVISKGILLLAGQEKMTSSIKTFAVAITPEMTPTATIVIYDIAREGVVIVDSLTFPVDGFSRNDFTVNLKKTGSNGETVEVTVSGRPGTYVGVSATDRTLFNMHSSNELNHDDMLYKMTTFDDSANGTFMHVFRSREGKPDEILHFPSSTYGIDAKRTFQYANLIVFTDANVTSQPDRCNSKKGYAACMDGMCYPVNKQCDEQLDCKDGSDESGCHLKSELNLTHFKLHRGSRLWQMYENSRLWKDINIGSQGYQTFHFPLSNIPTNWIITAFGTNSNTGFGIIAPVLEFSSVKSFFMNVEMPQICKEGEQIGIKVTVCNYKSVETEVFVSIAKSQDYSFVTLETYGRQTEQEHQVTIAPGQCEVIYLPIVAVRQGEMNVTVMAKTQQFKDLVIRRLHVEPDGIPQHRHTSLLLDLSQGSYFIKYLETNISKPQFLSGQKERPYVPGSNKVKLTVSGGVVGPVFSTMPVNSTTLLRKPCDGGEQNMFNFAANLYTLLYIRQTNQKIPEMEREALHYLNIGYQNQLSYQNEDGSFRMFRWNDKPSVWLTAFCVQVFHKAVLEDWKNFLFIDPTVISKGIKWLLNYQSPDGAFYETDLFPYDRKMNLTTERIGDIVRHRNISLTAHVLITLSEVKDLSGELGARASTSRTAAQRYLEKTIHIIKSYEDPFELAIVAYALTLSFSNHGDEVFNLLDWKLKESSGMRYWASEPVPSPQTSIVNNRPYLLPKLPHKYEACNIETTAYGLLVHVARQAVIQKEIVKWLVAQRSHDGGWASTQDTLLAIQALTEYSVHSGQREGTDITLTIESSSTPGFVRQLHIGDDNLSKSQSIEIPNGWGAVIVKVQGSGLAIVQLSSQYNVDSPKLLTSPPVNAFSLLVRGHFFGRNSSHITFQTCQRWTNQAESQESGLAVLEMSIPTGYAVLQRELDSYVQSGQVKNLRQANYRTRRVFFYFDYLSAYESCISFTVHRWYPVANLTRHLEVKVYDYYAPERYNQTIFDTSNLHSLDICQVCGSYQCSCDPGYSSSAIIQRNHVALGFVLVYFVYIVLSGSKEV